MVPSELLDLFIDGELDSAQEAQLFNALANDTELRSEFGNLMAIRSNIHRDFDAFAPSAAATGAVFSALNFAVPAGATAAGPVKGGGGFWKKFGGNTLSALCSAVIVYLLMAGPFGPRIAMPNIVLLTGADSYNHGTAASTIAARQNPAPEPLAAQQPSGPGNQNTAYGNINPATAAPTKQRGQSMGPFTHRNISYRPLQNVRAMAQPRSAPEQSSAPVTPADPLIAGPADRVVQATALRSPAPPYSVPPEAAPQERRRDNPGGDPVGLPGTQAAATAASGTEKYAVQARGISAWSFPNITAATNTGQLPVNIALAAYRKVAEDDAFGIEIGRESFTQRFTGTGAGVELNTIGLTSPVGNGGRSTLSDGSVSQNQVTYQQNPTVNWAAFGYRHTFGTIGRFQPYAHVIAGGTELGPLGRMVLGTEFLTGGMVRLTGGLEGSMMAYNVQGHWFTSQKIGFTYGISLLF